ncbi:MULTISPECIES: hypothetical protein [unclassified Streptomyces]|uniref:hypothetical protein n=1 Tax=unclassified Streptomyces TaxID=2593676 RepID=UPI00068DF504|nr:hypothetical protein [Streptomyces sp. PCS3-D2]WKV72176.1 hypothetical protein AW27_012005 [Streptomyces sp. PCS3-D2]
MIGLYILGAVLLFGAFKFLRGVYYIRKAKRLEAEIATLDAGTEAVEAGLKADKAAAVVALGFVAEEDLDTENPAPVPPERTAVLQAVAAGDWEAAAAYVEAAGTDWHERMERVRPLAEAAAADDDAWLLAWRAARPSDPTAALVNADAAIMVAWNVRGSQSGSRTTQEQFRLFRELLVKAQEAAHEAQRLADPADPTPYIVEQPIGQGLGYSHERYRELWAKVVERDPKVLWSHIAGLQYWCRKWRGSHELALAHARASAAVGEPGDLLSLLPLIAYFEQETYEDDLAAETYFKEPEIVAAVDAALLDLAAAGDDHPGAAHMRHLLAYLLFWQDRDEQAVEQFRHIDGYIGALPWSYAGSPKSRYLYARDWAVGVVTPGL